MTVLWTCFGLPFVTKQIRETLLRNYTPTGSQYLHCYCCQTASSKALSVTCFQRHLREQNLDSRRQFGFERETLRMVIPTEFHSNMFCFQYVRLFAPFLYPLLCFVGADSSKLPPCMFPLRTSSLLVSSFSVPLVPMVCGLQLLSLRV